MNKEQLLSGLNDRQREAVEYLNGPLLILAGAGSGKTRILTHRIAYLIESGVAPWHILAITFTNKAAREMRERTDRLLEQSAAEQVFVSTFHSMCVRLLRRDIEKLGYARDFTIYDADDQKTLVRQCIKALNLDTKMYRERAVQSWISSLKNEMVDAVEAEKSASDIYERNTARIYLEYEKQMKANNALDFDDLLIKTVDLFRRFPEVLEYWQERFRYIMVDEYQDTNNVQFELVRLLSMRYGNLCVVGDDDQSIYKFRGANIENILSFEKTFPGAKVIKLEQNYRSTKSILHIANEVIKNNKGRKSKRLWTENEQGALPVFNEYDTAAAEAGSIIRQAELARNSGLALRSQAILYRTNAQSRLLEERCISENLPYIIVGGVNFYQRKEIKDILAYLRVIANGADDLSARRIINVPKRGIGQTTVDRAGAYAESRGMSFYEALLRCEDEPSLGSAAKKIKGFTGLIDAFRRRLREEELSLKELIEAVRDDSGYTDELQKDDPVSAETRLENIEELINKAVDFELQYEEKDDRMAMLSAFLEDISLVSDIDRTNDSDDVLTMMTLHAAKGLEFERVYLCGMEDGLFPSSASINAEDPEAEIEEERRLCYVGFTRAMKELYLSSAGERMVNGETRIMKPSRFVDEIPDDAAEKHFRKEHYRRESGHDSFRGFGGYEGRMEYESSNSGGGYYGDRYGDSYGSSGAYERHSSYGSSSPYGAAAGNDGDRGYSDQRAYNAYNSFNERTVGRFGSLDTTPAGRNKKRGAAALSGIPGLSRGFGGAAAGGSSFASRGNASGGANGAGIKQKPEYEAGDRVRHMKFGMGTVVSVTEETRDYKVAVDFDEAGRKVMLAGFAKLVKV